MPDTAPVSYTHLDVYKRQVKNCYYEGVKGADSLGTGKTAEEMKAPAFVADLGAAFIADMKNPVNEGYPIFAFQDNTPKYEAVSTAVSYTHLDVYKRQKQNQS